MTLSRRDALAAELAMVEAMLREIPSGRVLERIGLEERADALREALSTLGPAPTIVALTFRGAPVEGSRAIVADFAGKVLSAFSEAVGTLVASITGELAESGPLTGSPERSLRIIGPATGSFGFQIELPEPVVDRQVTAFVPEGQDPYEAAVQETIALVDAAQSDDEELLAERVSLVHPRALSKVRDFVDLVMKREATFAIRTSSKGVEVKDVERARKIASVLADNDIHRETIDVTGVFYALPRRGHFELTTEDHGTFGGRIDRRIGDVTDFVSRRVIATVERTQVRESSPRYTLLRLSRSESVAE